MRRLLLTLPILALLASTTQAQPAPAAGPAQRPAFSPYLNLVNRGNNPGFNYLGIVRPQQQLFQQFGQLQQQYQQSATGFQQELNGLALGADPFLPQTGRVATFGNLAPYYTSHPVTGSGGGGLVRGGGFGASSFGAASFGGGFGAGMGIGGGMGRTGSFPTGGVTPPSRGGGMGMGAGMRR